MIDVTPNTADEQYRTSFESAASAFLPVDASQHAAVVLAASDWSLDHQAFPPRASSVVWGRPPGGAAEYGAAVRGAVRRETRLRSLGRPIPESWRVRGIHRLPPKRVRPGLVGAVRGAARALLRGGALVEFAHAVPGRRVLDVAAAEIGVTGEPYGYRCGAGGGLLARADLSAGGSVIIRFGPGGSAHDPAPTIDVLERLVHSGVTVCPRPCGRGLVAGVSWSAETELIGREPIRLTPRLLSGVMDACARFPRSSTAPTALRDDLEAVGAWLPDRARHLARLVNELQVSLAGLPAILRHGDLWRGNLLARRGRLSGLVDWDAAHQFGVPGADIVQLLCTEIRRGRGLVLGHAVTERVWRSSDGPTRRYWAAVDVRPDEDLMDLAGLAWWAAEVRGTLARAPARRVDARWLAENVDPVLDTFLD